MASLLFCLPDTTKREADKLVKSWPGLIQCFTVQTTLFARFKVSFTNSPSSHSKPFKQNTERSRRLQCPLQSSQNLWNLNIMFMKTVGKFLESDGENLQTVDFPEVWKLSKCFPFLFKDCSF